MRSNSKTTLSALKRESKKLKDQNMNFLPNIFWSKQINSLGLEGKSIHSMHDEKKFSLLNQKMGKKVLICDAMDPEGIILLKQFGFIVVNKPAISYEELKKHVIDCDVLVVRSRTKVTREIIDSGRNLKVIVKIGSGVDNIDVEYAEKKGVKVISTPEAVTNAVAELTIGLLLSLAREIPKANCAMKREEWIKDDLKGWELRGKTIGIIGCGRIGRRVAQIAKAFGMKILAYDIDPSCKEFLKNIEAKLVPFEELLRKSDVITIHVPLTPQTRYMIGEKEIQQMKDGAYIINTSRGAVIDEKALFNALQSGKIAGAALDVYEKEPPEDYSLIKLANVICTPHIGAQTREGQKCASKMAAKKNSRILFNATGERATVRAKLITAVAMLRRL